MDLVGGNVRDLNRTAAAMSPNDQCLPTSAYRFWNRLPFPRHCHARRTLVSPSVERAIFERLVHVLVEVLHAGIHVHLGRRITQASCGTLEHVACVHRVECPRNSPGQNPPGVVVDDRVKVDLGSVK